jgi:hypothetical protein
VDDLLIQRWFDLDEPIDSGPAAALAGAATAATAALAALTTGISLSGASSAVAAAAAALTTAIKLLGAASSSTSAVGALNSNPLFGAAAIATSDSANLTTQIQAAGSAAAAVSVAGSFASQYYRASRVNVAIPKVSSDGQYWGRYPQGNKPAQSGSAAIGTAAGGALSTGIRLAGATSVAGSASASLTTGGGGLSAVTQFQQVAQGGSTNNAGSATSPKMQAMLVWAPPAGGLPAGGHYEINQRQNYGANSVVGTTTNNYYVATGLTNFFSAPNIAQDPSPHGAPTGPTTVYDWDVIVVDSAGNRSAAPAQFTLWGYRGGITGTATGGSTTTLTVSGSPWVANQWLGYYLFVSGQPSAVVVSNTSGALAFVDLDGNAFSSAVTNGTAFQIGGDYFGGVGDVSFGQAAGSPAFTSSGGSPVSPHAFCLGMTHDASASDNMGLQRPSASPAGFIYGLEIGAYNYAVWNQRSPVSGSYTEYAMHHRGPVGDLAGPHTGINGANMVSLGYGPAQVANTWQPFAVPTSAIQCSSPAGGVTTFNFSVTGSTLTASGMTGPGIDDGCWITGTGLPAAGYVNPTPNQTGNGQYTIVGAGYPVSGTITGTDGKAWGTNMYKGQYKVVGSFANLTWDYDNIGWVRSNTVAPGA